MKSPIIGITLDNEDSTSYSKYPWYAARRNYSDSVAQAGGTPVFLPHNTKMIDDFLNLIDGLIITGGDFDVDPRIYGEKKKSNKVSIKQERTEFEFVITEKAIKLNLPILGICGGQQLLNVVAGGTLIQHIPDEIKTKINHEQVNPRDEASHLVTIFRDTQLHKITQVNQMYVNSAHHQAVKKLGSGFIVNCETDDGIIEGIENPELDYCLGIQWHPEFLIDEKDIEIFKGLIESSKKIEKQ